MNTHRIATGLCMAAFTIAGCGPTESLVETTPVVQSDLSPEPAQAKASEPPIVDEPDEEVLLAKRALQENCLICHSAEIIESQRLTKKQWKAEVEKMAGWGSPIAVEQQEGLIAYLDVSYPATRARVSPESMTVAAAYDTIAPELIAGDAAAGDTAKGAASFATNCKNCHGANGEGSDLGPNLVGKPVLTRPKDFVDVVNKGRGRMPMLMALVNRQSSLDILAWLKTKRFPSTP